MAEAKPDVAPVSWTRTMTDMEFELFSNMIYSVTGIKMPPVKKLMLTSRLSKRMKALEIKSYSQYYDYICSPEGRSAEFHRMIDAVTTNKTDFFRESDHFSILAERVIPELTARTRFMQGNPINIWSAGCSTGEEPYTIGMVASDYFGENRSSVSILATDISTRVLETAVNGIYTENAIKPIPLYLRKKYILRGKGDKAGLFRISPDIRKMVTFRKLNLMDKRLIPGAEMDIVFCRNVIIYFDRGTQAELFDKFYDTMAPGGYLFIGSSETLHGISDKFIPAGPTVYRKK
jgi:chemotaxis protein methyltransferase CheR